MNRPSPRSALPLPHIARGSDSARDHEPSPGAGLPDEPSWSVADGPAPGELGPLETRADSCPADCDGPATATSGPGPDESIHSQAADAVATTSNKASASINRSEERR